MICRKIKKDNESWLDEVEVDQSSIQYKTNLNNTLLEITFKS